MCSKQIDLLLLYCCVLGMIVAGITSCLFIIGPISADIHFPHPTAVTWPYHAT